MTRSEVDELRSENTRLKAELARARPVLDAAQRVGEAYLDTPDATPLRSRDVFVLTACSITWVLGERAGH